MICVAAMPVFPAGGRALAVQRDTLAEPLQALRRAAEAAGPAAADAAFAADGAARCANCHSDCEAGRLHEGRPARTLAPAVGLPLDAGGRATCLTCHRPHGKGEAGAGARLRLDNLRRELCLACHRQGGDDAPRVRIVSPPERAVVAEERLALIGLVDGPIADEYSVRINAAEFHLPVRGGGFATWLSLQEGVNSIEIATLWRLLWAGEVFRGQSAPPGYGRATFGHCTQTRQECLGCHHAEDGAVASVADADRDAALCYRCHDRFEGKRYLHGPLAVGACLACHDPHRGYGAAHLRDEQSLLCGKCHSGRDAATTVACAAPGKGCADCHDPHQSDSRYLLRGPKYTLRERRAPGR
jgi:predicted CXXCH cytochrome family protein